MSIAYPTHEGPIWKRQPKGLRKYQERYGVMRNGLLHYAKNRWEAKSNKFKGKIPLDEAKIIVFSPTEQRRAHAFGVQQKGESRVYVWAASSEGERKMWLAKLEACSTMRAKAREIHRRRVMEAKRRRAQAKAEAEARAKAEAEAEAKREAERQAEARRQAEAEAEARRQAERQAEAKRQAEAEAEARARAKAEADQKERERQEAEAKAVRQAKAWGEAEEAAKRERERQAAAAEADETARLTQAAEEEAARKRAAEEAEAKQRAQQEAEAKRKAAQAEEAKRKAAQDVAAAPLLAAEEEEKGHDFNDPSIIAQDHCMELKFIVVGDSGVGKSQIMMRLVRDDFVQDAKSTIGVEFEIRKAAMPDGKCVKVTIWDTAGQERFRAVTRSYYRGAHAAFVVHDASAAETLDHTETWFEDLESYGRSLQCIAMVRNKIDLCDEGLDDATAKAQDLGIPCFETSAKTGQGCEAAFEYVVKTTYNKLTEHRRKEGGDKAAAKSGSGGGSSGGVNLLNNGQAQLAKCCKF